MLATCLSTTAGADTYEFGPEGEFTVVFPATPSLGEYETFEGTYCETKYAILVSKEGQAGLRAESIVCEPYDEQAINKEVVFEMLKQHAITSGVSGIALEYGDSALGKTGTYRGQMEALGNTLVVVMVFGNRSAITLVGSEPYSDFPKLAYDDFVSTLRRISN